jgi:hypothetical protein
MNIELLRLTVKLVAAAAIIIVATQAGGGCRKSYADSPVSQQVDTSLIYYENHAELKPTRFTF